MIIAAHNEEENIRSKLESCLNLDYPKEKLEVIVASDGSTDRTNEIVNEFKNDAVRLLSFNERKGKTFVQNEAVKVARGAILLFSDATTKYDSQVIKKLVRNFADANVGAVGGELVYVNKNSSSVGMGGGLYWRYEKFLKAKESRITSLTGVSGCCYAVRKELYEPISLDLISDFVIAQAIYKKGKRAIYEPEAIVYEDTNNTAADEFKMRVRITVRTLYGVWSMKNLLNPFKYGFFSIQLFSHKILRYLVPLFLILLFILNIALLKHSLYKFTLIIQTAFYMCAILGGILPKKNRYLFIPFYFCVTNLALLEGFLQFLKGERNVLWNPIRG